ncbi:MAG: hypothetical protein KA206_09145, partial [Paludibacter sp.]|nr:hypothetical protein [Paludibacter sp.]
FILPFLHFFIFSFFHFFMGSPSYLGSGFSFLYRRNTAARHFNPSPTQQPFRQQCISSPYLSSVRRRLCLRRAKSKRLEPVRRRLCLRRAKSKAPALQLRVNTTTNYYKKAFCKSKKNILHLQYRIENI